MKIQTRTPASIAHSSPCADKGVSRILRDGPHFLRFPGVLNVQCQCLLPGLTQAVPGTDCHLIFAGNMPRRCLFFLMIGGAVRKTSEHLVAVLTYPRHELFYGIFWYKITVEYARENLY